jgi:hypothetical protein
MLFNIYILKKINNYSMPFICRQLASELDRRRSSEAAAALLTSGGGGFGVVGQMPSSTIGTRGGYDTDVFAQCVVVFVLYLIFIL